MAETDCRHEWTMTNVRTGYLVTEGCTHCGIRAAYFTPKENYYKDSYVDGDHKWRFLGSSQAVKFDLECAKCGREVSLRNVTGLMMCVDCKDDCKAPMVGRDRAGDDAWVYLAMCTDPSHVSGVCVTPQETQALTEYFNSRIRTPGKKVVFVPCILMDSIDTCQGEILADIGMKDLY